MMRMRSRLGAGLLGAALLLSTWNVPAWAEEADAAYEEAWDDEEPEEEAPAKDPRSRNTAPARPAAPSAPAKGTAPDEKDSDDESPAAWNTQVTEQDAARSQEYLAQGQTCFAMKYMDEARNAYDKAIALDSGNAEAYAGRAEVCYALGTERRRKSLDTMEQALARVELTQAVNDCTAALRLRPNDAALLKQRATVYQALGQIAGVSPSVYDDALADITAALKAKPDSYSLYDQRALIQLARGETDLALEDLYQALALNPRDYLNGYYRGLVFIRQEKYEEALAKFDEVISGGGQFAAAWLQKGIVCEKLGRPLDALYAYRTFLSLDREHDAATIAYINERFNAIQLKKK